jgi:hypothetical protein
MPPRIYIDGNSINLKSFVIPEMSLSSARATMKRHEFSFHVGAKEVLERMEIPYNNWVDESKQDDDICGSPQDELAEAGYPALRDLIKSSKLSKLVLGDYLIDELMGSITWDGRSEIKYWFDSITKCYVDGSTIELIGVCYSK